MSVDHLNRRDLLVAAGASVSCAGVMPSTGWADVRTAGVGEITDMTMNSPSYATPIGYGRSVHQHNGVDPLTLAFGS